MKKKTIILLYLVIIVIFVSCIVYGHVNKTNYNKTINNPPNQDWLEEDLEKVFLSTDVYVYPNIEHIDKDMFLTVRANGLYYKVHYYLKQSFASWYWEYDRYIEIKEIEVEENE